MANTKTTGATTAKTLELIFERLLAAHITTMTGAVYTVHCAHETAESKPPCIVTAVERRREDPHGTGIWECALAIDLRLTERTSGNEETLFEQIDRGCRETTLQSVLDNAGETLCVPGSVIYDAELSRELVGKSEISRVYAFQAHLGLIEP